LSENAQFADAVRAAGIIYIGPSSQAILTLGDKRSAKEYLLEHEPSIPLIPGYSGSFSGKELEEQASRIGFPVMIKASAGGGGRGMRIVRDQASLQEEVELAQSEAQRSFGSSDCILEKYIASGKHVEVQIMGDSMGEVISLWERDCSVQRRHQKIIEESPCAWLSQEQRERICAAAVRIGKLLRYEGAGTVEFMVDIQTGEFYFLEVNARLQVEHPITEECTGFDLVSLQLYVASGGLLQHIKGIGNIPQNGHAIECRLCAEDPDQNFAPQHGLVRLWKPSHEYQGRDVRYETAIQSGGRVSIYFDSMIAKIVVWAPTRSLAIQKMTKVLANTPCVGVRTNQLFLQACLTHPGFNRVDYTTAFIPTNLETLLDHSNRSLDFQLQTKLSVLAPLFGRTLQKANKKNNTRSLFRSIRPGFRNQPYDKVNVHSDIATRYDAAANGETQPRVYTWNYDHSTTCRVGAVPKYAAPEDQDSKQSATSAVTNAYNLLSTSLRDGHIRGSENFDVHIHSITSDTIEAEREPPWKVGKMVVSIDQTLIEVAVATEDLFEATSEIDTAGSRKIYLHLPTLGTFVEYRCYSLLSYFESQRSAAAGGADASGGAIMAPMPCKVLRVLKKNGDSVKTGEIVLVVESMKMEINISASKDGIFETSVRQGDGVDQGVVLCLLNDKEKSKT
jgi:acetyl/propionyl-CoA carboxylase alpha subunit